MVWLLEDDAETYLSN